MSSNNETIFPEACPYCGHQWFDIESRKRTQSIRQIVECTDCGRTVTDRTSPVEGPEGP